MMDRQNQRIKCSLWKTVKFCYSLAVPRAQYKWEENKSDIKHLIKKVKKHFLYFIVMELK